MKIDRSVRKLIKVLTINLIVFCSLLLLLELISRIVIDFEANYYAAPKILEANSVRVHPYGKIPVNSQRFFDGEWDSPKTRTRIAYFGDSVTYGVGAGYPYRVTEYLDELSPEFEHVNLSGGLDVDLTSPTGYAKLLEEYEDYQLDKAIYLMNLNDIAPLAYYHFQNDIHEKKFIDPRSETFLFKIKKLMGPLDRILRGNSVMYTYIRFQTSVFFTSVMGFEVSGYKSIELTPDKNSEIIKRAAHTLAKLSSLIEMKLPFCILILPYEMQISKLAAQKYKNLGVKFDQSFVDFKTQKSFIKYFSKISDVEIRWLGSKIPEADIGTYFVYDLGDKIDFNHPNRYGHKVLALEISNEKMCFE